MEDSPYHGQHQDVVESIEGTPKEEASDYPPYWNHPPRKLSLRCSGVPVPACDPSYATPPPPGVGVLY